MKKISIINKVNWGLEKYILTLLALVIIDLQIFGIFGEISPFRDYTVIFEGGYRILFGHIQYLHFYFPSGPMVFLIQGFFQFLFGSNLFAMAFHSFFLAIILSGTFYLSVRKEFDWVLSSIFAIFFYISFNGLMFTPWYDQVAYFFFFLNIFLLMKYYKHLLLPRSTYFLSAILVMFSFYSKQDVGLLQAFFILIYFIINYPKEIRNTLKYYLLPLIFLIGGVFYILSFFTDISYWFNLGQYPHSARFSHLFITIKLFNIISSWKFYLSIFIIYKILSAKFHNGNITYIRLMCLFLIVAVTPLITQVTSRSHIQTLVTGIPLLLFILYLLIKKDIKGIIKNYKFIFGLFMTILLLLTVAPLETYGKTTTSYFDSNLGRIDKGCYSGALIPISALEGLNTIREIIEKNNNSFISFTEYQFLYCDYGIEPPKGIPLCFHKVCFWEININNTLKVVEDISPKVILLQNSVGAEQGFTTMGYANASVLNDFNEFFDKFGYIETEVVPTVSENLNISVFVKR